MTSPPTRATAWTRRSRRSPRTSARIRTGRANPQLLNRIMVDYYGAPTPLQQLANFSVPEPRILLVNPFDKGSVNQIEKAIRESDLGLNPSTDGGTIRCVFPELTEERRKDFIKMAKQAAEDGKVAIRNVRRSARDADAEARGRRRGRRGRARRATRSSSRS